MIMQSCLAGALLAIGGMTNGVQIARTPVTNAEYAEFAKATGHSVPRYWKNGTFPKGKEKHPVVWVSYDDALDYCDWLGKKDPAHMYRLPTEAEWEAAAGPSPREGFNFNAVVANHCLKKGPNQTVTFLHPRSRPLRATISVEVHSQQLPHMSSAPQAAFVSG